MNRDDARDLLPLFAGDDLDPEARAAVAAALDEHTDLRGECEVWEELDAMLADAMNPEAAEAEPDWAALLAAPEEPAPVVRRHCPFCKDDLPSEAVVFCATCATPHHDPCFAENRGCSLLGCGGTESVTLDSARAQVCTACERTTPAGAPFCAWCGATSGEALPPRHAQVTPLPTQSWRPLLAAASMLLTLGLGVGGLFGLQQAPMVDSLHSSMKRAGYDPAWTQSEQEARAFLTEVAACQRLYRERDLDANGKADLAPSLKALQTALRRAAKAHGGDPGALLVVPQTGLDPRTAAPYPFDEDRWEVIYRLSPDRQRFAVLLVPTEPVVDGKPVRWWGRAVLLEAGGKIRSAEGAVDLDPRTLAPLTSKGS